MHLVTGLVHAFPGGCKGTDTKQGQHIQELADKENNIILQVCQDLCS